MFQVNLFHRLRVPVLEYWLPFLNCQRERPLDSCQELVEATLKREKTR